jgi:HEAT repeat protein
MKTQHEPSVAALIEQLGSSSVSQRRQAREGLLERGAAAVSALTAALNDPSRDIRWEAARTLAMQPFPWTAPALVHALEDDDMDVRWVVAEALIEQGREGARVILERLAADQQSVWFYQGAHHALSALATDGLQPVLRPVVEALSPRFDGPDDEIGSRALHALKLLSDNR